MSKKKIKNIVAGAVVVAIFSSPITIGIYMAINIGYNALSDYERTAPSEYNGESYVLFSLYKLISRWQRAYLSISCF